MGLIDKAAFAAKMDECYCVPCRNAGKDWDGVACRTCWANDMGIEVDQFETVDTVHRSRWIHPEGEDASDDWHECQSCGFGMIFGGDGVYLDDAKYCMGCGAKMEVEGGNEAN